MGARLRGTNSSDATCMTSEWEYTAFPYAYNTPIDVEEAELLARHPDGVDLADLEHLLNRVFVTSSQVRNLRVSFDNELRRREELASTRSMRQVLDPEQAVRYLTDAQVENIFDSHRKRQLDYVKEMVARILEKSLSTVATLEAIGENIENGNYANNDTSAIVVETIKDYVVEVNRIYSNLT